MSHPGYLSSPRSQDALRKCDAMPAFKPGGAGGSDTQQLLARQPLEPALGALRCGSAGCTRLMPCAALLPRSMRGCSAGCQVP